jgi:predicted CXXCH cytochrome family protein
MTFDCRKLVKSVFAGGVVISSLLFVLPGAVSAAVTMIYPEPGGAVTDTRHLVLKLGSSTASGVVVTVNGVSSESLPIGTLEYRRAFGDFLILQPIWDKGKNQLTVDMFNGEKKLETFTAEIYFAPKRESSEIPKEYRPSVMHRPEADALCVPCHNMRPTMKQVIDVPDKDNACFSCHKRMANQKYVHGPVSTYSCAYCHALQGLPLYATSKRDAKLCYDCHQEKEKELKGYAFLHGPVAAGMCEICHDSHGSDNPAQLHMAINKMCLSCHEQIATTIHVTTVSGETHPLSGKTDPSDRGRGRELSCISCHDPHGGKARYYFVTGSDSKMDLCQMCHKK